MTTSNTPNPDPAVPPRALGEPSATADPVRELQLADLEILEEFRRFCEKHSLRYYLGSGTLLGAVRHKGFVPWDDDIDVEMPRPDYDRFSELCRTELGSGYSWHTYLTDRHYPFMWGKLMRDGTELRQRPLEHLGMQQSIYIDVWPLDGISNWRLPEAIQRAFHKWAQIRLSADLERPGIRGIVAKSWKLVPRRLTVYLCERSARLFNYEKSRVVAHPRALYGYRKECMPREWFGDGAPQEFERRTYPGPQGWREYLTHVYGDYMKLPPEAERRSRHEMTAMKLTSRADGD
jgi:lipopolysaccharide cholinephosphotransferase